MSEYIKRGAIKYELWAVGPLNEPLMVVRKKTVDSIPAADVVPRTAYDQVVWERDLAIEQLREDYGVGLGEKKSADVVEVKHGEWEYVDFVSPNLQCSECGGLAPMDCCGDYHSERTDYCPNCGAKMDGGADN